MKMKMQNSAVNMLVLWSVQLLVALTCFQDAVEAASSRGESLSPDQLLGHWLSLCQDPGSVCVSWIRVSLLKVVVLSCQPHSHSHVSYYSILFFTLFSHFLFLCDLQI